MSELFRAKIIVVLILAALVALTQPAGAVTTLGGSLKFGSPANADFLAQMKVRGADASELRGAMDQNGDGNGQVSSTEVEDFETEFKDVMAEDGEGFGEDLQVDGRASSSSTINRLDIRNAEGAVSSTSEVTIEILVILAFPVTAADSHRLTFKDSEDDPEDETVTEDITVELPPGYVVTDPATLPHGVSLSSDKRTLTFDGDSQADGDLTVTIAKPAPAAKSPSTPAILGLGTLVALAGLLRRREALV